MMKLKCFKLLPEIGVPCTSNTQAGFVLCLGNLRLDDLASSLGLSHSDSMNVKDMWDTQVPG